MPSGWTSHAWMYFWIFRLLLLWSREAFWTPRMSFWTSKMQFWTHQECRFGHPGCRSGYPKCRSGHPECRSGHPECCSGHPQCHSGHPKWRSGHPECRSGHLECCSGHPECRSRHLGADARPQSVSVKSTLVLWAADLALHSGLGRGGEISVIFSDTGRLRTNILLIFFVFSLPYTRSSS